MTSPLEVQDTATAVAQPPKPMVLEMGYGGHIHVQHVEFLRRRAVTPAIAAQRRYFTAQTKAAIRRLGFSPQQCLAPALVIPIWTVDGEAANYQLRPDQPRVKGNKVLKYELPARARMLLDVPPCVLPKLGDPRIPLFITEGIPKADAAAGIGLACLALLGVWNWRGSNEQGGAVALPDWERIALKGRTVYIVFDSDVTSKRQVRAAVVRLKAFLESRGASVLVVYLPPATDGSKQGLDDLIAGGAGVEEIVAHASAELRGADDVNGDAPYFTTDAGTYWRKPTQNGDVETRLANFTATIEADVTEDDGAETRRSFLLSTRLRGRTRTLSIPAQQFGGMNWPMEHLGAGAVVYPGMGAREHFRAAVQLLSEDVEERHVYTHTGWRQSEAGAWVYLHAGGAIGADDLDVALPAELGRYALPEPPDGDEAVEAMRGSLRYLEIGDPAELLAPWAMAFLAPLATVLAPTFTLWLTGLTGSLKSTRAALALGHFGRFDWKSLPANFVSTDNSLERRLFLLKDTLTVVDDYAPQTNAQLAAQMDRTAERLLRMVGDHAGRGRLRSDTSARPTFSPRGVVVATGEQEPPGSQSSAARALVLPCTGAAIVRERLTRAQQEQPLYAEAMAAYLAWLAPQMDELATELPKKRDRLRDKLQQGGHGRLPEAVANLSLGLLCGLRFAVEIGAADQQRSQDLYEQGVATFRALAERQQRRLGDRDPTTRFAAILRDLLRQGRVYLRDRSGGGVPSDAPLWGWRQDGGEWATRPIGEHLGWVDGEGVYLLPDAYFLPIVRACRDGGEVFPVREYTLRDHLDRRGVLERDRDGKSTRPIWAEGRTTRVLSLRREAFERLADMQRGEDSPEGEALP